MVGGFSKWVGSAKWVGAFRITPINSHRSSSKLQNLERKADGDLQTDEPDARNEEGKLVFLLQWRFRNFFPFFVHFLLRLFIIIYNLSSSVRDRNDLHKCCSFFPEIDRFLITIQGFQRPILLEKRWQCTAVFDSSLGLLESPIVADSKEKIFLHQCSFSLNPAPCLHANDQLVLKKKLKMADGNVDYVRLGYSSNAESEEIRRQEPESTSKGWCCFCWWMKAICFCLFVLVPAAWFLMWAGLFLLNKVLVPMLEWEMGTFSTPMLGLLLFISLAIFPTLLLPSAPSMWITGMTFGYGYGFLLIMAATSLGMSLPYFIGSLFRHKIHRWLDKWPKKSAIIRLAGEGDWFHQFRAVALLRISPFPYIVFNYAVVATNVDYGPYIFGSLVGTAPEVFLTIYSGILIRNLADATHGHQFMSVQQIICDVLGFCTAIAATAAITIYAKRALKSLQIEDEPE